MSSSAASALLLPLFAAGLLSACAGGAADTPTARMASFPAGATPTAAARPTSIAFPATTPVSPPAPVAAAAPPVEPSAPEPTTPGEAPVAPAPAAPAPYRAVPFDLARAGLAVGNPSRWSVKRQDLALVYAGTMRVPSIVMFEPKARSLDEAVATLEQEVGQAIKGARITQPATATRMAGYAAYVAEGTGTAEGFPMRWRATVVDAAHPTIVLALAPTFFWNANKGSIARFERSITPRGGAR